MEWINNFKVRCSAIKKVMANSQSNPVLTELQIPRLKELEDRASGIGKPLTDNMKLELAELLVKKENSKKIILSDGCIAYLMEVYAWEVDGMIPVGKEAMQELAQISKGKKCEPDAIALLSVVDGEIYKTHKERIFNDYLSGEIDTYLGDDVYSAKNVTDIKNAFDRPTFLRKINSGVENGQTEQLQGYGDITGAQDLFVANTLVDNPDEDIEKAKYGLANRMNALTIESPEFLYEWAKIEKSMRFKSIQPHRRVFKIKVEPFSEFERQKVYDRVKVCREWLWKFAEIEQKLNLKDVV